ncbi:MAG: nucleotidyltransferase family protein [Caldilineaceae bacterium]
MKNMLFEPVVATATNGNHASKSYVEPAHVGSDGYQEDYAPDALELVRSLCQALREAAINYCHWKSNNALDRSANGKNDLDLLVDRADAMRFAQILNALGFKQAFAPAEDDMPGVLDYYGHDVAAGRIIHVHAHFQIMMGQDMTKNYHLPLEAAYLESATQGALFRTPSPEFELIVLVLRLMVKHATWDTILMGLGQLSPSEQSELTDLQAEADPQQIDAILREHVPFISPTLFADCLRALKKRSPLWRRIRAARKVSNALAAHTRRTPTVDLLRKLWGRGWGIVWRRLLAGQQGSQRRLALGGALIAVVGGDGAGKTSTIEHLRGWLGKELQTRTVHLGKPEWSLTTRMVRALLKVVRVLLRASYIEEAPVLYQPDARPSTLTVYSLALRAVCAARDRQRTYAEARRAANRGELVICDRFPLPQLKMMEGAQVAQLVDENDMNWFLRRLHRLELHYLQHILPPDLLIVLRLDPEIAVVRRSDEDPHPVRVRNRESGKRRGRAAAARDRRRQPQDDVLAQVRQIVWSKI